MTTLHGTDITLVGLDRSYLPITRFSIEQSDGVTAISQYLRERTLREFDIKNNIQVIYNFVNCDVYCGGENAAEARQEYAPNGERLLVHLSNFRPVKRVTDCIEIFDRVRKQIPSKLLMIGDGPDRSRAEWLAVQKGIHNDVIFLGKQELVQEKLAISDIMLLAQRTGIVRAGGAGGHGLRGRAHRHASGRYPGVDRARQERLPGRCRRRGHHGALRHRIAERRRGLARQWRKASRAVAQSRFCSSKIIPQYEEFYRRVLERAS